MGPKPATKGRARRTHSLGGCATCRRRHVKCDQVQPLCLTCKAVGVTCEGYASSVQWVTPSTSTEKSRLRKSATSTTRRHLYTEKSRASMSTELAATLSSNSVDASLTEIDSWSKKDRSQEHDNLAIGPFAVLNFNAPAPELTSQHVPVRDEQAAIDDTELAEELFPTPSTLDPLMSLDDSLQWADLFALDFGTDFLMQHNPFEPVAQDMVTDVNGNGNSASAYSQDWMVTNDEKLNDIIGEPNIPVGVGIPSSLAVSPLVDTSAPTANLLDDIQYLLHHFQHTVINAMAGVVWTAKSPWKSLNLATAVQTLADMTFLEERPIKHANAANLYSLVSCAARHLVALPPSDLTQPVSHWLYIADWSLQKAKLHSEQSMCTEFHGPRKAKYKDQLMATIGTAAACQAAGSTSDFRRYMLESERVLRLRGLAKRNISRKARFLHHIYTWTRIVGESTYVIHDYNSYAPVVQHLSVQSQKRAGKVAAISDQAGNDGPGSGHNARLDDFLRLDTQHDSDLEIDEPKEAEIGLHDIHLEDSRDYAASMYLEIYGIPETWLSLVSQTTRLANVMDTLKVSNKETNVSFQNALQKRASRLENMICAFAFRTASATPTPTAANDGGGQTPSILPNHYMHQALNSALVIFFYRRIRDVNPWILQSHVDDVITALQEFDNALSQQHMTGPGTAWPAFMAGCEAISSQRREALLKWIQSGRIKSGMYSYKAAEEVLVEVWRKRDESNNRPSPRTTRSAGNGANSSRVPQKQWTWVDVSREKQVWLMLC